ASRAPLPPCPGLGDHEGAEEHPAPRPAAQPLDREEQGRLPAQAGRLDAGQAAGRSRELRMRRACPPLTRDQLSGTLDAIASVQLPSGNIPSTPGGRTDPWN